MTSPIISGNCHCKSTTYTFSFPPETILPLEGTYDHRSALRLSIGFQCTLYTSISEAYLALNEGASARLATYSIASLGTLSFCTKCGTTLFLREGDTKEITLLASTIDIATSTRGGGNKALGLRDLVVPKQHIFVSETFHGGVSRFMNDGLQRFHLGALGALWEDQAPEEKPIPTGKLLHGSCHCNGTSFTIHRPDENYTQDAILKEWVKPGQKYCASYCFCHSCRAVSGAPFWAWAFIPRKQIHFVAEDTLRTYDSFKDLVRSVTRRFCSRCGCHLFFTSSSAGGLMWDVAVGALDQGLYELGEWFTWRFNHECGGAEVDEYIDSWKDEKMGFEDFGKEFCKELVEEVVAGLRQNL